MQSFYSVIKNSRVETQGKKLVDTSYFTNKLSEVQLEDINEEVSEKMIENYENLAKSILENARKQSDEISSKAIEDAHRLEKEAYEKGYSEGVTSGYSQGHDQGYKEAYDANIEKALKEAEDIVNNAKSILLSAQDQYVKYFEEKKEELIQLSLTIAGHILKRELEKDSSLDNIIFEALGESRSASSCVIRCKGKYVSHLKSQLEAWKERLAMKAEVFVVEDNILEDGNVVIEKNNGSVVVDIDDSLDKIRKEILG
ncbi:FliH/SctL family protein [Desnuesiella massiliensis]|uniref:FliH/SctL family protein n=1 Tax=Desnuesiella massiliensis TaxID=1650662 RepID=UPI0006E22F1E|nr:FliH/SctL family protein [Desnuesiella massiliensis]